ncbi:MAG: phage major capsid protein [Spirochaeta sp.]|nr:phage major capsid protein [Spirochaeta sp.]
MNLQEKKLREEMGALGTKMQNIVDQAKSKGRDLTPDEIKQFDNFEKQYDKKDEELKTMLKERGTFTDDYMRGTDYRDLLKINGSEAPDRGDQSKWMDPNTGQEVRVLGKNDKLYRASDGWDDFNMSAAIRAIATGDFSGAKNEVRAMDLTGTSAMVPKPVSQRLIDRARDMMVLNSLGMQTIPMSSSTLTIARVDGDPTPEWKAENAAFSNSDVGISGVQLEAKLIAAGTSMSHELAADAANSAQMVEETIARVIAGAIDRAGLLGSGTGAEPQGIFGAPGVTDTDLAASPTYDDFSNLYYRLTAANERPNGLVVAPRTLQVLDQLKDNEGRYLAPPQSWSQYIKAPTNAIPTDQGTGNDESIAIMGNFQHLLYGLRENLRIEVSRQASGDSENAWQELKVFIRVYSRVDFALARSGAFQTLSGIIEPV